VYGYAVELLERDAELAVLAQVARDARGAVLVEGPPGIGKSALLRAAAAQVAGASVLTARGTELEVDLAFGAVRQLLGPAVHRLDDAAAREALAGPAALAAVALGLRAHDVAGTLADPLYGLFWLTANLAERAPLVLVVDDLHWLDAESDRYVAYLAARLDDLPVALLAGARPGEPGGAAAALEALRDVAAVVQPQPLSREASGAVVGDAARAAEARRATGGNPLLLIELARELRHAPGDVAIDELSAHGVGRSVLRRVRRISPAAAALAGAVSLFPSGATLADAASAAELDAADAAAAADGLVDAQVLAPIEGRLEFLHPLMRRAVHDEMPSFARRAGHARAARALIARGAGAEEVAAHLLAGEPAADPESVRVLRAAADAALAAVAPRAAVRYLERALTEGIQDLALRQRTLLDLARLQRRIGVAAAQVTAQRSFECAAGPEARVAAGLELALSGFIACDHATVLATARALESADLSPDERLLLDMVVAESAWALQDIDLFDRLINGVPPGLPGTTAAQRLAIVQCAVTSLLRGAPVDRTVDALTRAVGRGADEALALGTDIGDPLSWLVMCEAFEEAQALAEQRLEAAAETGDEALFAAAQRTLAWIAADRGQLRASLEATRAGLKVAQLAAHYRHYLGLNGIVALIRTGAWDQATADIAAYEAEDLPEFLRPMPAVRRSELLVEQGRLAEALPALERLLHDQRKLTAHPNVLVQLPDYVRALAAAGRRDEALELLDEQISLAERIGGRGALGWRLLARGQITGDLDDLRRALEVLRQTQYGWHLAMAQLELGAALRRDGQRVRAREHLRAALDYATREQAAPLGARAREELGLTGARPRRAVLSGVESLTPGELRIARLAADGLANKEIAQRLFLTVKTIEMTLSRAYRKLDIQSRRDLPAALS
jgi:DNA-binding CsgD family transcriptional regulator